MRYYLKSAYRASIKALKTGDDTDMERIHEHNEEVLRDLFDQLVSGKINMFYNRYRSEGYNQDDTWESCTAWHRSTRPGVLVQESHMLFKNGDCMPCSHHDINSFEELMEHRGYTTGVYYKTV